MGRLLLSPFKVRVMCESVVPLEVPKGPVRNLFFVLFHTRVFKVLGTHSWLRASKESILFQTVMRYPFQSILITTLCRRAFLASFEPPPLRKYTRTAGHGPVIVLASWIHAGTAFLTKLDRSRNNAPIRISRQSKISSARNPNFPS